MMACITTLAFATTALLLGPPTKVGAFSCPPLNPRAITLHHNALSTSSIAASADGDDNDDDDIITMSSVETVAPPPDNPFLVLLSTGLHRTSVAMDKSTSDQVFQSSASLHRLRKQVQQLTNVGPSSLGEHAGLGLFATKNIKAGTVVGLYPAHALGYELVVPIDEGGDMTDENNLQDLSMFLAGTEEDQEYFEENAHGNSPYLHATDQPLFQRPSLLSSLFDDGKEEEEGEQKQMSPPLYLDVNPNRNEELDGTWTSHYINDGASLLDFTKEGDGSSGVEKGIEKYYTQSKQKKNCIHIPFGPSPLLATVTTKKVKKGQELFTSYGVVYWLGAVEDNMSGDDDDDEASPGMTEKIQDQIIESARDLQKAMGEAQTGYETEMADLESAMNEIQ